MWFLYVLSMATHPSVTLIASSFTDMVSPLMALHSLSWMLLSCLMLLSQVQGKIFLLSAFSTRVAVSVHSQEEEGSEMSHVAMVRRIPTGNSSLILPSFISLVVETSNGQLRCIANSSGCSNLCWWVEEGKCQRSVMNHKEKKRIEGTSVKTVIIVERCIDCRIKGKGKLEIGAPSYSWSI